MVDQAHFESVCRDLTLLFVKKNNDYGNAFAELRKRYPQQILVRLNDKLMRLETLMTKKNKQLVYDESIEDTLRDLANYAIMELMHIQEEKAKKVQRKE